MEGRRPRPADSRTVALPTLPPINTSEVEGLVMQSVFDERCHPSSQRVPRDVGTMIEATDISASTLQKLQRRPVLTAKAQLSEEVGCLCFLSCHHLFLSEMNF